MLGSALVRFGLLWFAGLAAYLADATHRERIGIRIPLPAGRVLTWAAAVASATALMLDVHALGGVAGTAMCLAELGAAASLVALGIATVPRLSLAVAPALLLLGVLAAVWP